MILSDLGAEAPSPWNWIEIAQSELLVLFHYDPWVSELDKQLRSVKLQAAKAQRFQEYSNRLRELRVGIEGGTHDEASSITRA